MAYNVKIKQNNDFVRLIENNNNSKNIYKRRFLYNFFKFSLFVFYTIFIVSISFSIFTQKESIKYKINQNFSNVQKLKLLTYNIKSDYEGAKNCLEKNPDNQLCIYQFKN